MAEVLQQCIGRLASRARQIIALRYQNKMSGDEVAARLKMKTPSVYVALGRIHRSLRDCMNRAWRRKEPHINNLEGDNRAVDNLAANTDGANGHDDPFFERVALYLDGRLDAGAQIQPAELAPAQTGLAFSGNLPPTPSSASYLPRSASRRRFSRSRAFLWEHRASTREQGADVPAPCSLLPARYAPARGREVAGGRPGARYFASPSGAEDESRRQVLY